MKAILICPEHRPAGGAFQRMKPLALMPVLGRSLLDHTLAHLKKSGVKDVTILASDRPEMIRKTVGKGQVWGLHVEVIATPVELEPAVAEGRYGHFSEGEPRPRVMVIDELPTLPGQGFWETDYSTFENLRETIQTPGLAECLTMQEVSPNVWISSRARVSAKAEITGPVWIGPRASVGAYAVAGPNTIIESGAFIDSGATIEGSWVGPSTYVGATASIIDSCAWGDGLLKWKDGSFLEVRDSYLLHDLAKWGASQQCASLVERLLALLLWLAAAPFALSVMLRSRIKDSGVFTEKRVIFPPSTSVDMFSRTHRLLGLSDANGYLQRWPELLRVVSGRMALVGNRPLSPEEVTALRGELGRLWLAVPAGVFSLADAEGVEGDNIADSLAHAAFFSVKRTRALRLRILCRCLGRFFSFSNANEPIALNSAPSPL